MITSYTYTTKYYITNKMTGIHKGEFENPYDAVREWRNMPLETQYKYGVSEIETYMYYEGKFYFGKEMSEDWIEEWRY